MWQNNPTHKPRAVGAWVFCPLCCCAPGLLCSRPRTSAARAQDRPPREAEAALLGRDAAPGACRLPSPTHSPTRAYTHPLTHTRSRTAAPRISGSVPLGCRQSGCFPSELKLVFRFLDPIPPISRTSSSPTSEPSTTARTPSEPPRGPSPGSGPEGAWVSSDFVAWVGLVWGHEQRGPSRRERGSFCAESG